MAYNITGLQTADTVFDLFKFANDASTASNIPILSMSFVIGIFIVSLVTLKKQEFSTNLAVASFISMILSGMLWFGGFMIPIMPLAFMIILAFDMLYIYSRG